MSTKNIEDAYPLSPMQQGMLFHSLSAPNSGIYVEQFGYQVQGELAVEALERAWQSVLDRHPILRTAFVWENLEKPLQIVAKQVKLPWQERDWRGKSETDLEAFLERDRKQGFILSRAPLMRFNLIRLSEDTYRIIWTHHHILLDGWSLPLLLKEVLESYEAFCQGRDLLLAKPRPYRDYIAWLQQQDLSQAEAYWREKLKGFTAPTSLGIDRNSNRDLGQEEQQIHLSATIQSFARQHQLTLNTLVQGAYALLLSRYSGENDVVFGATSSGRPAELEGSQTAIGLFINTLPVRVRVTPDEEVLTWLKELQTQLIEARQYEYSPLVEIQGWSEVPRGVPLFETIVVFENYPVDDALMSGASNLTIQDVNAIERTNYPITVKAALNPELVIKITYDRDRFDKDAIARMLGHLQTLLEGIAANPQQRLQDLSLLTDRERQTLLVEWNETQVNYSQDCCLQQLFEAQVEKTPDAVAVVFGEERLTYQQLNSRANQLAHYLQKLGVKAESLVGICLERSLEMVVGLLGILKAGSAYVPIDPSYPPERLAFLLEDSQPKVVLSDRDLLNWETIERESTVNPVCQATPDDLAYVIYTSGSTGQPKGAMNTHRGIVNRLLWMQDAYQLNESDVVLQKTPFSFDVSVWEFFLPLLVGSRLAIAKPEGHKDSAYLVDLIAKEEITTVHFVPSMLQIFLEEEGLKHCHSLKRVIASGEELTAELQQRFFERLDAQLHNLYGPTEAAIDVTAWTCQPDSSSTVPIGKPIANMQIYILDPHLMPVPIGIVGELYIGGAGLARGYLNRPDLTERAFIPNPFSNNPNERLYKTGDLARYLNDGNIEFMGRSDRQVKIRGFRIELGEIESVLRQHPAVREAVVRVWERDRLAGYVVPHQPDSIANQDLQRFLKSKLPDYMVPSALMPLAALPLLPNGKIDRRSLPAPDGSNRDAAVARVMPQTELENAIAQIWKKVLKLDDISVRDNFFDIGGHSLLLANVYSQLRAICQTELSMLDLFRYPTIATLADAIAQTDPVVQTNLSTEQRISGREQQKKRLEKMKSIANGKGVNQ